MKIPVLRFKPRNLFTDGLITVVILIYGATVAAEDKAPDALALHRAAFSAPSYKFGTSDPQPVYADSDLHPDFAGILAPYPQALAAAKDSLSYSGITVGGWVIVTIGAALALKDSLDDADDLSNDQLPENDNNQEKALAWVVLGGAVVLYGSLKSSNALDRAVTLYNRQHAKSGSLGGNAMETLSHQRTTASGAQLTFGLVEQKRRVDQNNKKELMLLTNLTLRF